MKVNFNGTTCGNLGLSNIEFIIRDSSRATLLTDSKHIKIATNKRVDFSTTTEGLELTSQMECCKIHLEGDSIIVVNAIRTKEAQDWKL